jgi:hypothetical protein
MESDSSSREKPPHTGSNPKSKFQIHRQIQRDKIQNLLKNLEEAFVFVPCHSGLSRIFLRKEVFSKFKRNLKPLFVEHVV